VTGGPGSIPFLEFLNGGRFLALEGFLRVKGAEDIIERVQENPAGPATLVRGALGDADEVIHVDVPLGDEAAARVVKVRVQGGWWGFRLGKLSGTERDGRWRRRWNRWGVGQMFQPVGCWVTVLEDTLVGYVGDRLGGRAEERGRQFPAHRQCQRERDEPRLVGPVGKHHGQFGDVPGGDPDAVEAV